MKSIASVLSIIALGFGLLGCPSSEGGSTPAFAVSTTAADFGVVGNAYTSTLAATGGTAPFTWTVFGGVLPAGLSLNAGTGVVSGIPGTPAGNFNATFTVTDSTGKTATGSVLFAIHPRTDRVSVNGSGVAGVGASSTPSISGDGSLVAFASSSTNFVTDVNGAQIYVHNRQTNQIELVSRDNSASVVNEGNGVSSVSAISADGRYVAFVSLATNLLAPGAAVPAGQQIYVRDRQTGLTSLVSVDNNVAPNPGTGVSSAPSISADGRYVAFVSLATNLLAPGAAVPAGQQIYIRDSQLGQSFLASQDNTNTNVEGTGGVSDTPSMNSNGGFVAFLSQATNLVTTPPSAPSDIYVRALP
jgi:Tol biopolymer transport system component